MSSGSVDNPGGGGSTGAATCPWHPGAGCRVQASDIVHVVGGVQREVPFGFMVDVTYVGRRGLYLPRERNINQLRPGTVAQPGVKIAALRPYKGYGDHPPV